MAPQILFIGLGNMGRGMCKNLVEKGSLDKPLLLFNRTKKRADDLATKLGGPAKAEAVESIEEGVIRADIIFSCLSNDAAVEEAFDAILKVDDVKGKLFVDCSTIHPDTTDKTAKRVGEAGADFVASPVFGAPPMADAGQLIFVPAGPKKAVDRLRPYIKGVCGKAEIPMEGKPYGMSLRLKLIGNTFILNMITQLAEGLTLGEKSGVGAEAVADFASVMFGGPWAAYAERMMKGTYWKMEEPLFSADNAIKDANHALDVAKEARVEMKGPEIAKGYLQDVATYAGGAKGDIAGIYGAVRARAGLKYENDA